MPTVAIDTATRKQLIELYIAYFNRAPDADGLNYWSQKIVNDGWTVDMVAKSFMDQQEVQSTYPSFLTLDEFISKVYNNVLNRNPDTNGQNYWKGQLESGAVTKPEFIMAVVNAAHSSTGSPQDAQLLDNKVAVGEYYAITLGANDVNLAKTVMAQVTADPASVQAAEQAAQSANGQPFMLTTGVDAGAVFEGGSGNDTYIGIIDQTGKASTFTALDTLNGKDGTDTLNLKVIDNATGIDLSVATVQSIEKLTIESADDVDSDGKGGEVDTTVISDLTNVDVTKAVGVSLKAASTVDVSVANATGTITLDGGNNVTVTDATADKDITIGATTGPAGDITVTDSDQGTGTIDVDGGVNVTVNATAKLANAGSAINAGTIKVGANTAASGDVKVVNTLTSDATKDLTGGAITVTGGKNVTVEVNATQNAKDGKATGAKLTNGNITVNSDGNTESVTVKQTYSETEYTTPASGQKTETATVVFGALKAGDALTLDVNANGKADVGELTFTASKDMTEEQVAAAFAELTNPDTQSSTGPVSLGVYTGTLTGWTSSTVDGSTVVFTSATANTNVSNNLGVVLTNTSGKSTAATVTNVDGAAGTGTSTTANAGIDGAVAIDEDGTAAASITTVTVDGFGQGATLGGNNALDAITDLTLKNSKGGDANLYTTQTKLNLTVDNVTVTVGSVVNLDKGGAKVGTLNLTATGSDSNIKLTAAALKDLTIDAQAGLDVSSSTQAALGNDTVESVTITGSGAVDLGKTLADETKLNSFNASANTGGVAATVEVDSGTLAGKLSTYEFSKGNDSVTLQATTGTTVDVSVNTNDGDDTVTFFSGVTGFATGKTVDAGAGTDTIAMDAADLTKATAAKTFQDGISGFERVTVGDVNATDSSDGSGAVAETVDLANLDNISYVNVGAIAADAKDNGNDSKADGDTATLNIKNLAANGTVNLTAAITNAAVGDAATLNISLADDTGNSDVLNLMMTDPTDGTGITNTGSVVANNIETVNITVSDKFVDANNDGKDDNVATHTLILSTDSAATINISGASNLKFTDTDTSITLIDAQGMTGNLTATANNNSETILGGSGNDTLTAATGTSQVVLKGGDGNDILTGANLTELYGGAGKDVFVMNKPSNLNSYAIIKDLSSGDVIDLDASDNGSVVFKQSAIVLGQTAVFQDYANAAVNALGTDTDDAAWFQYGGNTYIVQSGTDHSSAGTPDFQNGTDSIIQITGLVDLSSASYNQTYGTLEIA
jgi:S-layer protein